jgi:predicted NACHT family NTPase
VELPREFWRRLVAHGYIEASELPEHVDRARLEEVRRAYQQHPARPVLDVLGTPGERKVVILGAPGSGKSTLAKYLTLALAAESSVHQGRTGSGLPQEIEGRLPLLVELRGFADPQWRGKGFLDFLDHLHEREGLGLPRKLLEDYLRDTGEALVVFDGLDEIFDPKVRSEVTRQIDGFAARYPKARLVVTSRSFGYNRQVLHSAGFKHYEIQDLDSQQIKKFVTTWYAVSCPGDPGEAARLAERVLKVIADSPSVALLAGNPMLLTILAIIGRRRELPRDRRGVYEHAVTVLVAQWDAKKYLDNANLAGTKIPDLNQAEKLQLLRVVARRMQEGVAGQVGNWIPEKDLFDCLEAHLKPRFTLSDGDAAAVARALVAQFRERNFILCRFGPGVYGFVHRTFLEYLTAQQIDHLVREHKLTVEEVQELFVSRCFDPAWEEVLLLLMGMLPERFQLAAITHLLQADPHWRVRSRPPRHLFLVLKATREIHRTQEFASLSQAITDIVTAIFDQALIEARQDRDRSGELTRPLRSPWDFELDWIDPDRYRAWFRSGVWPSDAPSWLIDEPVATICESPDRFLRPRASCVKRPGAHADGGCWCDHRTLSRPRRGAFAGV